MAIIKWTDVPEGTHKCDWLEYKMTIECACGKTVELYDADLDSSAHAVDCECGRVYSMRLVFRMKLPEDSRSEGSRLWPRVGYVTPPILMKPSPQFEQTEA